LLAAASARWDMSDAQIAEIEQTGRVLKFVTLYAPAWATPRRGCRGHSDAGEALMQITDLGVWAKDIYESDIPYVKIDDGRDRPAVLAGKGIPGRISFWTPADPQTGPCGPA
jgi:hypothetical protein